MPQPLPSFRLEVTPVTRVVCSDDSVQYRAGFYSAEYRRPIRFFAAADLASLLDVMFEYIAGAETGRRTPHGVCGCGHTGARHSFGCWDCGCDTFKEPAIPRTAAGADPQWRNPEWDPA